MRLIGPRGFGKDKNGRAGGDGGVSEPERDFGVVGSRHVDDDRGIGGEPDSGEKLRFGGAGESGEKDVRGEAAIREREFCSGGGGESSGNTGDDFEMDPGGAESFHLLRSAAKEKRIASFEADDDAMLTGSVHEESVDVRLSEQAKTGALADVYALGGGRDEAEDFGADERVVENDLGGLKNAEGFNGKEVGITGSSADEKHFWATPG